jgi:hypothetical protein
VAEIKSTLELAMERTKKMTISEEEREEIKQKEVFQKATGLFHRYTDGSLSLNEVEKEIGRLEERVKTVVKEILLSKWLEALSLNSENEKPLRGIESLRGQTVDPLKEKLDDLLSRYREEKGKVKEKVGNQWVEALKREGIYGSAVDPSIETSEAWKEEIRKLDQQYGIELEEIKEGWRSINNRKNSVG